MLAAFLGGGLILMGTGILLSARLGLRPEAAFRRRTLRSLAVLRRSLAAAVEEGRRAVVCIGSAPVLGPQAGASLNGLAGAEAALQESLHSDRAGWIISAEGSLHLLAQDVADSMGSDAAPRCLLPGLTPYSAAAGTMLELREARSGANLLLGQFGPEGLLVAEACQDMGQRLETGSSTLSGQAAVFASGDQGMVGEDFYAAPAYLAEQPLQPASLLAQDALRWLAVAGLGLGFLLSLLGWLP